MSRLTADQEGGRLLLNDRAIPGVLQRVSVKHELATDDRKRPGRSGSSKQPMGFQDATVQARMTFFEEEAEAGLKELASIFYALDERGRPVVYRMLTRITRAFGINQVLFTQLSVDEELERTDLVVVTLQFVQFRPIPPVSRSEAASRAEKSLGTFVPLDVSKLEDRMRTIDDVTTNPLQLAPISVAGLADREASLLGVDDGRGRRVKVGPTDVVTESSPAFPLPKARPKTSDDLFTAKGKPKPAPSKPLSPGFDSIAGVDP